MYNIPMKWPGTYLLSQRKAYKYCFWTFQNYSIKSLLFPRNFFCQWWETQLPIMSQGYSWFFCVRSRMSFCVRRSWRAHVLFGNIYYYFRVAIFGFFKDRSSAISVKKIRIFSKFFNYFQKCMKRKNFLEYNRKFSIFLKCSFD